MPEMYLTVRAGLYALAFFFMKSSMCGVALR